MTFSLQELTILNHIDSLLKSLPSPKRHLALANHLVVNAQQSIREQRRRDDKIRYLKKRDERNNLRPTRQICAKLALSVGDIVIVRGTRDEGIREIISFDGTKAVCHKLLYQIRFYGQKTANDFIRCGKTTNDLSNVTHIRQDKAWVPISEKSL